MNISLSLSDHTRNTIAALPAKERAAVCNALDAEFMRGDDPTERLLPYEYLLYTIIRFYVARDIMRGASAANA